MIQNIIFDLGNVLLRFRPDRLIMDMYKDEKIRDAIMEAVFRAPEWQMLDRGTIDIEDATVAFVNRSPRHEKEIRAVMEVWTKALTPIDPHVRLLEDLKRKGMHCYILSNFHKEAFEEQQALHSFFSSFDGGVVSAYVQLLKPERDMYISLLEKYDLDPSTCLFLDDMPENIEAAKTLGIHGIQVRDGIDLQGEVKKYLEAHTCL